MIYKSTREEVQAYFLSSALNQSTLKLLKDYNLAHFHAEQTKRTSKDKKPEPDHFRQGGAVDILLTGSQEDFDAEYKVSDTSNLPSEATMKIMDNTFAILSADLAQRIEEFEPEDETTVEDVLKSLIPLKVNEEGICTDIYEYVITSCNKFDYHVKREDDSRYKTIMKAGQAYFEALIKAMGKVVIPTDMYSNIKAIVSNFKNSERTAMYFDEKIFKDNPNLDIYYQKIIYFVHEGRECKAMLDILIVDKTNPDFVLFHPVDVKTMAEAVIEFPNAAKRLRYDIQAAWYKLAIINSPLAVELSKANREYRFNNFRFLVETTSSSVRTGPLVWTMDNEMVSIGYNGKPEVRNSNNEIVWIGALGITQLLNIYDYHVQKEDNFRREKITYENPAEIPFGWNYSKLTGWF